MATKRKAPTPMPVSVEIDGVTHSGTYTVSSGMITVSYVGGGSNSTQVGGLLPQGLAQLILTELVKSAGR